MYHFDIYYRYPDERREMKRPIFIAIVTLLTAFQLNAEDFEILMVIPELYGANYNFNSDHFQSMGFRITTAGTADTMSACNSGLPPLAVDTLISQITDVTQFDAVAIMPSRWLYVANPYGDLIASPEALALVESATSNSIPLWSTCAGPLVLAAADVLQGVTIQGRSGPDSSFMYTYQAAGANYIGWGLLPVIDGSVITTSRGQYYQRENCQAVVSAMAAAAGASPAPISICANRERSAGDAFSTGARDITQTSDGGYIICGYSFSETGNHSDLLLCKTDSQGGQTWAITAGSTGFEYGNCAIEAQNGDLITAGYTTQSGSEDFLLIRTDSDGNVLWEKVMGTDSLDIARSVCEDPEGNLYVCGYTTADTQGESDVLLIKTDSSGNAIWEKRYGGNGPETADRVQITPLGNLLIAGSTGSYTDNYDALLILADSDGNLIWENYYGAQGGEGGYDRANAAVVTSSGRIALAGESNDPDNCGMYFVLTDSDGEKLTESFHGNIFYDYAGDIIETPDGGFILVGASKDRFTCDNDLYIVKLNENGELVWEQEYGEENLDEWGTSIEGIGDGYYMVAGQRETEDGSFQVWVFQIEDTAQGMEPEAAMDPAVFPNPASSSITVSGIQENSLVNIYDMAGRNRTMIATGDNTVQIDVNNLPCGIYTVTTLSGDRSGSRRFTVMR